MCIWVDVLILTPKRRSMTRVKELTAEGINVSFGSDDIFRPLESAWQCQYARPGIYGVCIPGICLAMKKFAILINLLPKMLPVPCIWATLTALRLAKMQTLLFLTPKSWYDALNNNAPVLRNYRKGKLIASTAPVDKKCVFLTEPPISAR